MKKLHRLVVVLAVVLGIAAPAAAHNKIAPVTPAIDLRDEIVAHERVQTLPMFAGTKAFDEVAHVDLPSPSIADELARRFAAADVEPSSELAIFSPTVSRKLALGPLGVFEENNVNQQSYLGRELHRGLGYARNRWYDPATGTFLTPDPMGYADSSNLYSFCAGDPVNGRDPLGLADGYFGGLLNDDFSINPKVLDAKLRASEIWVDEQIDKISNPTGRAAADELKKLPDTVVLAAVTRANPAAGAIGGIAGFTNCHQQSALNRTEQSELLGQDRGGAMVSLIALNDCIGYNKFLRVSFGWDPVAGDISSEQQEREAGEFTAQAFLAGIFGRLAVEPQQEVVVTWPKSRRGRLGSPETKEQIAEIAVELEKRGWTIKRGGGRFKEEYLPGPGGARKGSSWADLTAEKDGRILRINTVDTLADRVTPNLRESRNAARIRTQQKSGEHLLLIPKKK